MKIFAHLQTQSTMYIKFHSQNLINRKYFTYVGDLEIPISIQKFVLQNYFPASKANF